MEFTHKPVLLAECIEALHIRPEGIYVDGTLGRAGHSREIAQRLTTGRLVCIDRDQAAIDAAQERLAPWMDRVTLVHSNFDRVSEILAELDIPGVDGMLFDLGVSSPQLDDASRGFSYMHDAPLDMRMDATAPLTAYDVVNTWSYEELRRILFEYGEERYAPAIAKRIVQARETAPVQTTLELAELIRSAMPAAALREKAAPGQAELSGHPHCRQRRAGRPAAHAQRSHRPPEPRRPAGRHHLPFSGGPHCEAGLSGCRQRLHLPAGISGVRVWEKAQSAAGDPEAHRFRERRSWKKTAGPAAPSCGW